MDARDTIIADETSYLILKCEMKTIYQPDILGISPLWSDDQDFECSGIFEIKEYQLYLNSFNVTAARSFPVVNGVEPELMFSEKGIETVQYNKVMIPIKFTGAVIIGNTLVKNYGTEEEIPCYSYKEVREYIFQDGKLVTTIDHSKAMLRIRKNLDLGLRDLSKARDIKCIRHYLKTSFVGDYEHPENSGKAKRKKKLSFNSYLQKIKNYYSFIRTQ